MANFANPRDRQLYIMSNSPESLLIPLSPKPYLAATGDLIIPMNADPKYKHWQGGQSVLETLQELNAPPEVIRRFQRELEDGLAKSQAVS